MKKTISAISILFAAGLFCCQAAPAEKFTLHKLFSPHMVLQRDKPIRIFGVATSGNSVTVNFAGKSLTATADATGNWLAEFPAMKAGKGYTIEVVGKNPKKKKVIDDVAIGEVWLCSGQSNMDMPVWSKSPFWRAANAEEEVKNANWPDIRLNHVALTLSPGREAKELRCYSWQVCNSQNVKTFSALGYFFARQLHKDLKVPVGIIQAARGGTGILSWMPQEAFVPAGQDAVFKRVQQTGKILENSSLEEIKRNFDEKFMPWMEKFNATAPEKTKAAENWKNPDFDDSCWESWSYDHAKSKSEQAPRVVWYRNAFQSIPADYANGEAWVNIPKFTGTSQVYLNGKLIGKTNFLKPIRNHSFKVPQGVVVPGKNVIAIRLCYYYGGDVTKFNDVSSTRIAKGGAGRTFNAKNWKMKTEYSVDSSKIGQCPELYDAGMNLQGFPGTLFNGMIAPLTEYPVRGVLWYQGESDSYFARAYYPKLRELIKAWRTRWQDSQMPFIVVQLAGCVRGAPQKRLPDDFWKPLSPAQAAGPIANLREVQGEIGKLPDVGLITAIDVGDSSDAHPRDKQTLGFRAAKEAERLAYGYDIVSRGPTYRKMKIEGSKIRIYFDNIGGGLISKDGNAPHAFSIAGKDGKYVWADAVIDGDTVVVSSPKAPSPVNVRYAWVKFRPDLNLCNKEDFPAFPFRTDAPEYK